MAVVTPTAPEPWLFVCGSRAAIAAAPEGAPVFHRGVRRDRWAGLLGCPRARSRWRRAGLRWGKDDRPSRAGPAFGAIRRDSCCYAHRASRVGAALAAVSRRVGWRHMRASTSTAKWVWSHRQSNLALSISAFPFIERSPFSARGYLWGSSSTIRRIAMGTRPKQIAPQLLSHPLPPLRCTERDRGQQRQARSHPCAGPIARGILEGGAKRA